MTTRSPLGDRLPKGAGLGEAKFGNSRGRHFVVDPCLWGYGACAPSTVLSAQPTVLAMSTRAANARNGRVPAPRSVCWTPRSRLPGHS